MVLPRNDAIYMVPKPLQKLGGDSLLCPSMEIKTTKAKHVLIQRERGKD